MRRALLLILLTFAFAPAGPAAALAAIHVDHTFGRKGLVLLHAKRTSTLNRTVAVAIEPDGGLILATGRTLRRLDTTGRLDRGFGKDGRVKLEPVPGGSISITGATVDMRGRILVLGTSTPPQPPGQSVVTNFDDGEQPPAEAAFSDARLTRLLPDGRDDPVFGRDGSVETDLGLPTPEYEGVKLSQAPSIWTVGIAVDEAGRIVITGGAAAGLTSGCYHDDRSTSISDAAFVARFGASGRLDSGFGVGGLVGGLSLSETPLRLTAAGTPTPVPDGGILFRQGQGTCGRGVRSVPGYVRLDERGKIQTYATRPRGAGVTSIAVAPDGSAVLLVRPPRYWALPDFVEKLLPDGSPDPKFGSQGKVVLPLSKESSADRIAVTGGGEILVGGFDASGPAREERRTVLVGLRPNGDLDRSFGPDGIFKVRLPHLYRLQSLKVDAEGRPTITAEYRLPGGLIGFEAARFDLEP